MTKPEEEKPKEAEKTEKPFKIKAGFNMYTATASLRAMEPPTDLQWMERLSMKPGHLAF